MAGFGIIGTLNDAKTDAGSYLLEISFFCEFHKSDQSFLLMRTSKGERGQHPDAEFSALRI